MAAQLKAAFKSLPWYIVGGFLFGPLILAPFTLGGSLMMYLAGPYGLIRPHDSAEFWIAAALVFGPGFAIWILRQFWRFAFYSWSRKYLTGPDLYRAGRNVRL